METARARRLLVAFESVTGRRDNPTSLAFDLAFGDSTTRARARAGVDTVSTDDLFMTVQLMGHPRLIDASEEPMRVLLARPDLDGDWAFRTHYRRGEFRSALDRLSGPEIDPVLRALRVFRLYQVGWYPHPEELERIVRSGTADTSAFDDPRFLLTGALALDRGDRVEYANALGVERARARASRAEGDSAAARDHDAAVLALEGYALWKDGRKTEAVRALEAAQQKIQGGERARYLPSFSYNVIVRWWLGDLLREMGRLRDAERYYKSISADPFVAIRLGGVYEALGEHEKAEESYEYAVFSLAEADEYLQPLVEEARRAREHLLASREGS